MKSLRVLPALLLAFAIAGCSSSGNPVATNGAGGDPAATYASADGVRAEANALPVEEFEVDTYADGDAAKGDMSDPSFAPATSGTGTLDAAIDPGFWFRLIRTHERRYVVEFEEPDTLTRIANVRVIDRLTGTFNVVEKPDTVNGEIIRHEPIRKPLADTSVRKARFVRHRILDSEGDDATREREDMEDNCRDGWTRWRLVAVSGAEITSDDGTRAIQGVRLQAGPGIDVTVTDPLALVRRAELLRVPPGVPMHVTVTTSDPTDVVVLYSRWGRMRLRPQPDGSFQGRFITPLLGGLKHVAVNALSRGTLYDDVAPYDSKAWGLPYVVADAPPPPPLATN